MRNSFFALMGLVLVLTSCKDTISPAAEETDAENAQLPFFGEFEEEMVENTDGTTSIDTIYYPIPKFSFINQSSQTITHKNIQGKIVVSDFFFTECKSICPMLSSQMLRMQALIEKEGLSKEVIFLSHSVDPLHDRPDTLKKYAETLGVNFDNWHFLTVDTMHFEAKYVYELAQEGYYLTAFPSDTAQGGFFHTDKVSLLDRNMRIRGYYDGTSTEEVDKLLKDLKILINEPISGTSK